MVKKFGVSLLVILMAVSFAGMAVAQDEEPPVLAVGDTVRDFSLPNGLTGEMMKFSTDIKGKAPVTALIFMNTGCSACLAEVQEVSTVAGEVGDKLAVYAIAVDKRGEAAVKAYNEMYKFNVSYLLDQQFTLPTEYGFAYTPAMLLVDKSGKIIFMKGGYNPSKDKGSIATELKKHI